MTLNYYVHYLQTINIKVVFTKEKILDYYFGRSFRRNRKKTKRNVKKKIVKQKN